MDTSEDHHITREEFITYFTDINNFSIDGLSPINQPSSPKANKAYLSRDPNSDLKRREIDFELEELKRDTQFA